ARLDDGKALAVKDRRHRTAEHAVDLAILCKVRDLRSAAKITKCRQQIVLNDRPQHHARTKPSRLATRKFEQLIAMKLELLALDAKHSVARMSQREASTAFVVPKKWEVIFLSEHLRRVPVLLEIFVSHADRRHDLVRMLDRRDIDRRRKLFDRVTQRINDD